MVRFCDRRGFSLVELMVAIMILSLLSAFGMRFLILQHRSVVLQEDAAESQQQLRAALDLMTRDLMSLGFGVPEDDPRILKAGAEEIQFLSNLNGAVARLSETVEAGQNQLGVYYLDRSDKFRKGKSVSICSADFCERHVLAKDGGWKSLDLGRGLGSSFPKGSAIHIINVIQYILKPTDSVNQFKIIRRVDGGSSPVAEDVASMRLDYLDRHGRRAPALEDIQRIGIELSARFSRNPKIVRSLLSEVYLRN